MIGMKGISMKRKIIIALTVIFIIQSLVSCGKPADNSAVNSQTATGKYEQPLTIEMVKLTNPVLESELSKLKGLTGETLDDNRWIRLFKDELNIEVKYRWVASGQNFDQKWRSALASGDVPDVVGVNTTDFQQLAESEIIHEMGPLYDQYATDLTKRIMKSADENVMRTASYSNKVYGIPQVIASFDNYKYMWLRKDWLGKLGLKVPKTTDELLDIMKKFVENDPDGNGKKDTYATVVDKDLWYRLEGFFWAFGAYPDTWLNSNGALSFGGVSDKMKKPLSILRDMYKSNSIDSEFFVKDDEKARQIVADGKCGLVFGGHWEPSVTLKPNHASDPKAEWGCYMIPTVDGTPVKGELEMGVGNILVVSKDYKNPEAIIKMLNLYYDKLYGENSDYAEYGSGVVDTIWGIGPLWSYDPMININAYRDIAKVTAGSLKESDLKGPSKVYFDKVKSSWDWGLMFSPSADSAGKIMDKVAADKNLFFMNGFYGSPTETMVSKGVPLGQLAYQSFINIITGKSDIDQGFAKYVTEWKRLGGDKMTEEVNTWKSSLK